MQTATKSQDSKSSLSKTSTSSTGLKSKTQAQSKLHQATSSHPQDLQNGMDLPDSQEREPERPLEAALEIKMEQLREEVAHKVDPILERDMLSSLRENGVSERDIGGRDRSL